MHFKVSGKYRLQVVRPDGTVKQEAEFDNLVTDAGLNYIGNGANYLTYCQVGSGSTAPSVSDTALASRIAGSSTQQGGSNGAQASAPYYSWRRVTYLFSPGTATGNIAEVGVGWSSTGYLFSRALVLDSGGSPTTITVLADETLYVSYELRLYPQTTDSTGEVTLTGNIGGTYDWTWRSAEVSTSGFWDVQGDMGSGPLATMYSGAIGSVTQSPSGTGVNVTITARPYSNNSLERVFDVSVSLAQANYAGGIESARFVMGPTCHQVAFDPAIPKTASDTLNLVISHSWGRV